MRTSRHAVCWHASRGGNWLVPHALTSIEAAMSCSAACARTRASCTLPHATARAGRRIRDIGRALLPLPLAMAPPNPHRDLISRVSLLLTAISAIPSLRSSPRSSRAASSSESPPVPVVALWRAAVGTEAHAPSSIVPQAETRPSAAPRRPVEGATPASAAMAAAAPRRRLFETLKRRTASRESRCHLRDGHRVVQKAAEVSSISLAVN